jgi:hypothetical protein
LYCLKPEKKRCMCRLEGNIKTVLEEIVCEGMHWTPLSQCVNFQSPYSEKKFVSSSK